jgi:hypothetical protein
MADAETPDITPDITPVPAPGPWRHFTQCVIAEQRARLMLEDATALGGEDYAPTRRARAKLATEAVRVAGALEALRDDLTDAVRAAMDDMRRAS